MGINYTDELANLVRFTGNTALAIRQYCAYSAYAAPASRAARDVKWLSDSLHNFEAIGRSVIAGQPRARRFHGWFAGRAVPGAFADRSK